MKSKLTLRLDKETIVRAKEYATMHSTSLSQLVEAFFITLAMEQQKSHASLPPTVKELSGVISLPDDFDAKAGYGKYLLEKYGKSS